MYKTFVQLYGGIEAVNIRMMYNSEKQYIDDPETNPRLLLAIVLAYAIVITVFLAAVGIIYGSSQLNYKLDL